MKVSVVASTKLDNVLTREEAIFFSGRAAGVCYMQGNADKLYAETREHTMKRAQNNLKMGHNSVFGHVTYNFIFENIPKVLAMILNNEKVYNTSEKSARYTTMNLEGKEESLYKKWVDLFSIQIVKEYGNMPTRTVRKLAQENARYLISIFTPCTTMMYTTDFRQLNYIINMCENYISNEPDTNFSKKLKPVLREFVDKLAFLKVEEMKPEDELKFSLFADRERFVEFGENYSTNYLASFTELAQAQRHRTISYEFLFTKDPMFYVPEIIRYTELEREWLTDISSLQDNFAQGQLIQVNERGTIVNFALKCRKRICGAVQLEIQRQTQKTLYEYLEHIKDNSVLRGVLEPYKYGTKCTFKNGFCNSPCIWGPKDALTRKV